MKYFDHILLTDKLIHLKIQSHGSLMENTCKEIWVRFPVMATYCIVFKKNQLFEGLLARMSLQVSFLRNYLISLFSRLNPFFLYNYAFKTKVFIA